MNFEVNFKEAEAETEAEAKAEAAAAATAARLSICCDSAGGMAISRTSADPSHAKGRGVQKSPKEQQREREEP